MAKTYTCEEYFDYIVNHIELPEILDYSNGDSLNRMIITEPVYGMTSRLDWGDSEGIYLDIYNGGGTHIGTFKTLENSSEAMHIMANLLADFICKADELQYMMFKE